MRHFVLLLIVLTSIISCSGNAPESPVQNWEDLSFRIETRPDFISKGMMEFLVIANRAHKKPASGMIISLRMGETGKWIQAIEDGNVGVYRRAVRVNDPATDVLYVHIERKEQEGILKFPLNYGIEK